MTSSSVLRLHVDLAYYATCCCVVGLAIERFILVCHFSDAQTLLSGSFRVKYTLASVTAVIIPTMVKVFEDGDDPWLNNVQRGTHSIILW